LAACSRIGDGAKLDGGFMDLPSANDEANKLEVNAAVCSLPDRKTNLGLLFFVRDSRDLMSAIPQFYVVSVDDLLRALFGGLIISANEIDPVKDIAGRTNQVRAVLLHN
jgi:hypothetical protein